MLLQEIKKAIRDNQTKFMIFFVEKLQNIVNWGDLKANLEYFP